MAFGGVNFSSFVLPMLGPSTFCRRSAARTWPAKRPDSLACLSPDSLAWLSLHAWSRGLSEEEELPDW